MQFLMVVNEFIEPSNSPQAIQPAMILTKPSEASCLSQCRRTCSLSLALGMPTGSLWESTESLWRSIESLQGSENGTRAFACSQTGPERSTSHVLHAATHTGPEQSTSHVLPDAMHTAPRAAMHTARRAHSATLDEAAAPLRRGSVSLVGAGCSPSFRSLMRQECRL